MTDSVGTRVETILTEVLGKPIRREEVGSRRLRDLGLESLRMIRLLAELESKFGLRIRDDQVNGENFGTLDKLVRFLESQVEGAR